MKPTLEQISLVVSLWWPDLESRMTFLKHNEAVFHQGFQEFARLIPETKVSSFKDLWPHVSTALSMRYLGKWLTPPRQLRNKATFSHSDFREYVANCSPRYLAELCVAAALLNGDGPSITYVSQLIDLKVRDYLLTTFSDHSWEAEQAADALQNHVVNRLGSQGFFTGRPVLLQFAGESTLITWLKTVGKHLYFDLRRMSHANGDLFASDLASKIAVSAAPEPSCHLDEENDGEEDERASPEQLLKEMLETLPAVYKVVVQKCENEGAHAQVQYLRLLGLGKSFDEMRDIGRWEANRMHELSRRVYERMLDALQDTNPSLYSQARAMHYGESGPNPNQRSSLADLLFRSFEATVQKTGKSSDAK